MFLMESSDELSPRMRRLLRLEIANMLKIAPQEVPADLNSAWLSKSSIDSISFIEMIMDIEEREDDNMRPE